MFFDPLIQFLRQICLDRRILRIVCQIFQFMRIILQVIKLIFPPDVFVKLKILRTEYPMPNY